MNGAQIKNAVLAAFAAAGAWIAQQIGGWDSCLAALVCMMAIDYITGLLLAAVWHKSRHSEGGGVSSGASFKGLVRKFVILLLVWLGAIVDRATGANYIRSAVCMFFVANEGLSILENTALMGVPYPAFVKNILEAMRDQSAKGAKSADSAAGGGEP
jgi:toxin secretion/phage lysis holin